MQRKKSSYIFLTLSLVGVKAFAQQNLPASLASQQLLKSGRDVFVANCSGCHGMDATGNGPAAPMLNPRPRNLVSGSFKFRSTPTGTLPTINDLLRTIDQGVLGTSMPSFKLMSQQEKYAVATYIMSLRPDWKQSQGTPIFIPQAPAAIFGSKDTLLASATRGHKLFVEACLTCHGERGLGDGPGSEGLMDGEDRPIRPANLQRKYVKAGRTATDIFKNISTGLDGTPMPSFVDTYSEAQRWDLVAFVFYLRGVGNGSYSDFLLKGDGTPPPTTAPVTKASAPAPAAPAAPAASKSKTASDEWR